MNLSRITQTIQDRLLSTGAQAPRARCMRYRQRDLMIESTCYEVSWCNGSKRLWPITGKTVTYSRSPPLSNGICVACNLCVIQRSRRRAPFPRLLYVGGSQGLIGKAIHAESGADEQGLAAFLCAR